MQSNICAVIVTYNPKEELIDNINRLLNQVNEIIIVDNSIDSKENIILDNLKKVHIIKNNINLGIAKALNIGVKIAKDKKYKWIMTLDQDSLITENMIDIMMNTYNKLENKEKIMIIAPRSVEKTFNKFNDDKIEVEEVITEITSGNIVKSILFDKIGFFEEKLFIDLVDHEMCLRVNMAGLKIIKVNKAILLHSLGETKYNNFLWKKVSTTNHSPVRRYYMARNRIYVWGKYEKNFPNWVRNDKKLFINEIIRIILFEKEKRKKIKLIIKGIKDGLGGCFGEYKECK